MKPSRAWAAILMLTCLAGCGGFSPPTTAAECAEAARGVEGAHSEADVGSSWTLAYSEESHPLGSSATIYLCIGNDAASTVTTDAPEGVEVDPGSLPVGAGPEVVEELEVTVTAGDPDRLTVTHLDADGSGGTIAIELDVDDDGWSFGRRVGGN